MLGELWHLGTPRDRVRLVEIRPLGWRDALRGTYYLPLPVGALPGCGEAEAHSALSGALYAAD